MNMPKGLQSRKMRDELNKMGVSSDLVDLEAHIDSNLSYGENYINIMSRYKNVSRSKQKTKQNQFGIGNVDFGYAHKFEQARSRRSRETDESTRHSRTYTERQIAKKPTLLDKWYKNPGHLDILGIDAFGFSKTRKKRR